MDQSRKKKAQAVFAKLQAQKANKNCIDCDAYNPQWASVNNACLFCIKCAGTHRSLGVHLSFVRSVGMDSWADLQLEAMKAGGNAQLLQFWKDQGFPKSLSSPEKYDNDAMEAYRAYIKGRSKGENPPFPKKKIGYQKRVRKAPARRMNSLGSSASNTYMGGMGNTQYHRKPVNQDNFFAELTGSLGSMTSNLSQSVGTGLSRIAEKTQQIDTDGLKSSVSTGWGNFSGWVSEAATNAASNLKDLADNQGDDDGINFKEHLRRNVGVSGKKMASLGSTPVRNGSRSIGTGKKMPAMGSDQYFGRNQAQEHRSSGGRTSVGSPPATKKKKYGGMSSEAFFEKEDEDKLDEFYGKQDNEKDDDLDDFGFSDDDEEEEDEDVKSTRQVLGKISVADDDDDDIDIDNWGWDEDDDGTKV